MRGFLQGCACQARAYGSCGDVETILQRAESKIGETGHGLVLNNCEHVATWCCTARAASEQVRGTVGVTAQGVVTGTTIAAGSGVIAALETVAGLSGAAVMTPWVGAARVEPGIIGTHTEPVERWLAPGQRRVGVGATRRVGTPTTYEGVP